MNKSCRNCDNTGWVCENHPQRPWDGESGRHDACGCGAGAPCEVCQQVQRHLALTGRIPVNGALVCGQDDYGNAVGQEVRFENLRWRLIKRVFAKIWSKICR